MHTHLLTLWIRYSRSGSISTVPIAKTALSVCSRGTHTLGVLTDDEVFELSTKRVAEDCLAERGTVLAMRPLLIHSSSKSQTETPRRVLHIEYAGSNVMGNGLELALAVSSLWPYVIHPA